MRYCITGGIGAGKSYICQRLKVRGIEIYDCDQGAKRLLHTSLPLRKALISLIGPNTYNQDGTLNKAVVAAFLLASEENKQSINRVVHPAVIDDFYNSGLQWMESAILYEAHLEHSVDKVIAVIAPIEVRLKRVMNRDGITQEKAMEWISKQANQDEVARRADYTIINDGVEDVDVQINELLFQLEAEKNDII